MRVETEVQADVDNFRICFEVAKKFFRVHFPLPRFRPSVNIRPVNKNRGLSFKNKTFLWATIYFPIFMLQHFFPLISISSYISFNKFLLNFRGIDIFRGVAIVEIQLASASPPQGGECIRKRVKVMLWCVSLLHSTDQNSFP